MADFTHPPPARIQHAFREALASGVFPGAVLWVQHTDGRRWLEAYGVADTATGEAVRPDTVFDLASLTKPLCTTLAVMQLMASGQLGLEDRLGKVLEDLSGTDKANILIRHLLAHQAGFPAWQPYFEILREKPMAERRDRLVSLLAAEPLPSRPGAASLYSDLDFLMLQIVVETVSGQPLDQYAAENIYRPLDLAADLFFTSPNASPPPRAYAATEHCPWRGRVLKGHVHDDNAYCLGGVAGHAGLFGTAGAVGDLLNTLLTAHRRPSTPGIFDSDRVRLFFKRCAPSNWALGFDTPSASASSSGLYFSPNTVGHLGFTGTSFWMDLEREIIVVLLTNRVHPSRANEDIRSFRPLIHDCIMEALGAA